MSRPDSGSKSSEAAQPGLFVVRCIERAMLGGIDGRLMKDKTELLVVLAASRTGGPVRTVPR